MDISITKPYSSLGIRDITFDYTTIRLDKDELQELYIMLDEELSDNGETKEELLQLVKDLNAEIDDLNITINDLEK